MGGCTKTFPGRFTNPNLVPMMTIQRAPYSAIYNRIKRPLYTVASACLGCLVLLLAVGIRRSLAM